MLRNASNASLSEAENVAKISATKVFCHATAVTALNPKSIVFFIAFAPQFIIVDSPLITQFVILVATFVGLAAINALTYAFLADELRAKIVRLSGLAWLSRSGGIALVLMGVTTAILRKTQ